jgi:hypothetical protein
LLPKASSVTWKDHFYFAYKAKNLVIDDVNNFGWTFQICPGCSSVLGSKLEFDLHMMKHKVNYFKDILKKTRTKQSSKPKPVKRTWIGLAVKQHQHQIQVINFSYTLTSSERCSNLLFLLGRCNFWSSAREILCRHTSNWLVPRSRSLQNNLGLRHLVCHDMLGTIPIGSDCLFNIAIILLTLASITMTDAWGTDAPQPQTAKKCPGLFLHE